MAIKVKDGYKCGYCLKFYTNPIGADKCKESHNLIYVAISKDDLNGLLNFIYLQDEKLLPPTLVERLQRYLRNSLVERKE